MERDHGGRVSPSELGDEDLILGARAGDPHAVAELFLRHSPAALRVALGFVQDSSEAEDIAVESFYAVVQAINNGGGPAVHFRAYLFTAVRNRARAALRQRNKVIPTDDQEVLDSVASEFTYDFDEDLKEAFGMLPPRWQEALWFAVVREEPREVAARRLGVSPNGFSVLLRRAKNGLRAAYESRSADRSHGADNPAYGAPSAASTDCIAVMPS